MQPAAAAITSYASYHVLLKPDVSAPSSYALFDPSTSTFSAPPRAPGESYSVFETTSSLSNVPAYLVEDAEPKKDAYASWDASSQLTPDTSYSAPLDPYASVDLLNESVAKTAYSRLDEHEQETSAATSAAAAPVTPAQSHPAPTASVKKERRKPQYRDWNEGAIHMRVSKSEVDGFLTCSPKKKKSFSN